MGIMLNEVSPDVFSMKLGQLKPGSRASIKLTYIMELPVENGQTRLTIPTTIVPKYGPKNHCSALSELNLEHNVDGDKKPADLSIGIEMLMNHEIKNVSCPTHDLRTSIKRKRSETGQYKAVATLRNGKTDIMNRDLVLMIESDVGTPVVMIEKREDS